MCRVHTTFNLQLENLKERNSFFGFHREYFIIYYFQKHLKKHV